jgi:hypothetical protein
MSEINDKREFRNAPKRKLSRMLDTIGCGLCFIWVGIAILANLGWGIGLIGMGVLILGRLAAGVYLADSASGGGNGAENLAKSS